MKKSEIGKKSQLLWKKTSQVSMIEINCSDSGLARIIQGISTEYPFVAAYIRTNPSCSVVERIRENDLLPRLQGNVRIQEPVIFKHKPRRHCIDHTPSLAVTLIIVKGFYMVHLL